MAKTNRAPLRGKAGDLARHKKITRRYGQLLAEFRMLGLNSRPQGGLIQGAVRVICLAGPAGPGARVRQAITAFRGLRFAARAEVD